MNTKIVLTVAIMSVFVVGGLGSTSVAFAAYLGNVGADGFNISYQAVYKILGAAGRIERSAAKSKKRKWVRFERKHSNAMWHVDWHTMKDPRLRGLNLIVYLDDASRCITGFGLFEEATSSNAVLVLTQAMRRFGTPATILSDNGRCFVGAGKKRKKEGWKPTVFQECLLDNNIELINTRPYHPQTNGKIERLFRTIEEELYNYKSMEEYLNTTLSNDPFVYDLV